jgi:predicted alpha/beta superfamily hydrolase
MMHYWSSGARGAQLTEALHYKSEGRGFDFFEFFRTHFGPGVDTACTNNEYQKDFLGVKAADA